MAIKYMNKTQAKLIVSYGSGSNRVRKTKRITYNGKKDAERQYEEFKRQVLSDMGIDSNLTVEKMLDNYIQRFKMRGGKQTTVRAYEVAAKPVKSFFKGIKANDVNLLSVEGFVASEAKIRSPKTIKNEMSLLSSAYKQAVRRGAVKANPCEYAEIPKQVKPEIIVLTDAQIDAFLHALDSAPLDFKVLCELALFCGLRKSEILGLLNDDVGETVTVSKVRHRINGVDVIQPPKTKASVRTLAVPQFILDDIAILKQDQMNRATQCDYLIRNAWGEPTGADWCDKKMRALIKSHDLPHVTIHGLRHTYASMLISEGVPVSEVSAQLGHASIDITLRIYTHLFTEASTASKRISDMISAKWAPIGHRETNEKAPSDDNSGLSCGADERIRT